MRIDVNQVGNELTLTAELQEGDRELAGKASLARKTATLKLPDDFSMDDTHPDLLALAALITFYVWIGKRLELPFPVSQAFADTVMKVSKIDVTNSSKWIPKRTAGEGSHPGLSFSGGVDSMAALALMPKDTVSVFTLRTPPPEGAGSLYKPDVALHAIAEMGKAGTQVHAIETDHEWVRNPVGFAIDPAPAVPLILLADKFNLDAITFGTIAESAYLTGKGYWADYKDRVIFTRWGALFEAVGLESYNATAGISEVGSSTIVRTSEFGYLAQSCIRGVPGRPCRACVKCFRKSLITASLTGEWPDRAEVGVMMANRAIRGFLDMHPIRFEIVLTNAMASYDGDDPLLLALQTRLAAKELDVSFTQAWYAPAMDLIPERYRAATIKAASQYLPQMTPTQEEAFHTFDLASELESKNVRVEDWLDTLSENAKGVAARLKAQPAVAH
ncbi:DUF6395 domain-containing protein [Arthrobacter sp. Leaf69]|uniref:DUF6395 domain-containing protein n=1 Tax=Arthrobacter sp. Leaf69 TaxID=1736232 RepID=UPI0006F9840C|nr:DUF6395 domain-containing protein [Arthrobacter sp. Leaf69]KQN95407.1 hypothetical protein ASE96_04405 [Arthrobacter sp. Leaf69]